MRGGWAPPRHCSSRLRSGCVPASSGLIGRRRRVAAPAYGRACAPAPRLFASRTAANRRRASSARGRPGSRRPPPWCAASRAGPAPALRAAACGARGPSRGTGTGPGRRASAARRGGTRRRCGAAQAPPPPRRAGGRPCRRRARAGPRLACASGRGGPGCRPRGRRASPGRSRTSSGATGARAPPSALPCIGASPRNSGGFSPVSTFCSANTLCGRSRWSSRRHQSIVSSSSASTCRRRRGAPRRSGPSRCAGRPPAARRRRGRRTCVAPIE